MTATTSSQLQPTAPPAPENPMRWAVHDGVVMMKRNLKMYPRVPQLLVFSTIQPVMFVLLFRYVFGGAIQTPGFDYVQYLMPGIFAQAVLFGSTQTGVGLAYDLKSGLVDRFRSLPMARSAVLAGRTLSDSTRNLFVMLLMLLVGTLIGFRIETNLLAAAAAIALGVLFGFAFSWISALIGMSVGDVETAQVAGFIWIFPLVFASSAFVPTETMPSWLQPFAEVQPVTQVVNAMRALFLGGPTRSYVLGALAWIIGILIVFMPLAVWRYRRT